MKRPPVVWLNVGLVLALAAAGGGAWWSFTGPDTTQTSSTSRTTTVRTGAVTATVTGSGNVESASQVTVDFESGGTLTAVRVSEGDVVKKGRRLARVDPASAERALASAKASLLSAQAQYDDVAGGQSAVERKKDEIAVADAERAVADAKSALADARESGDDTAIANAKEALEKARDDLELQELSAAQNADSPTTAELAQARSALDSAKAAVDEAEEALDATTLVAPQAGTVLSVAAAVGETVGSSGSGASSGADTSSSSGFVVLADLKKLEVTASVAEADAEDVEVGQAATVTLSASGQEVPATVTEVSVVGTTSDNVVTYPVTVTLDEVPDGVRLGASASVSITTGSAESALVVPVSAVTTTGNRSTATVVENGAERTVEVEVGLRGDSGVQILSGLTEGQTVVLTSSSGSSQSGGFPGVPGGGGLGAGLGGPRS